MFSWGGGGVIVGLGPGPARANYTPKVFSALKTPVPQQARKRFDVNQRSLFSGKEGENIYTKEPSRYVGDLFAHYWCIDFGLL